MAAERGTRPRRPAASRAKAPAGGQVPTRSAPVPKAGAAASARAAADARPRGTAEPFPRHHARTRRFSLGEPRTFAVGATGAAVLFLRSRSGTDPVTCLWAFDLDEGQERLLVDPSTLETGGLADLPEAERRRRERARESAEGITAFSTNEAGDKACFAVAGELFLADVRSGHVGHLPAVGGGFDPRLDPTGLRVAYVADGGLRLVSERDGDRVLVAEEQPDVTWGLAEFVAGEEMGRSRGFWWSPTGQHLAVARVDTTSVLQWYVADPANPQIPPTPHRYPRAGTANAKVSLYVVALDGSTVEVRWDRDAYPYLANVVWQRDRPLTLVVQSRDQRRVVTLVADITSGACREVHTQHDDVWVELVPGAPRWAGDALVTVTDRDGARRLELDGVAVTPIELQVRAVVGTLGDEVVVAASEDPTQTQLYRAGPGGCEALTSASGVHSGVASGAVLVVSRRSMEFFGSRTEVHRDGTLVGTLTSVADKPKLNPKGAFYVVGERALRTTLLLPRRRGLEPPFPVLLDPYGGPHAQRVVRSRNDFLVSQWFADQGFAVLIVDGRGTPGRGPDWERAVWGDLAAPVLDDQVDALAALAAVDDRLDASRVGIRGWSFGGYLAALAVMRRPDVFAAGIAGAPVTDWRLYDTHYTERYLGHPDSHPEHYERTNLLNDAARLRRPLMLIHGLADDNVVVAHTLQLSSALLAAGRPHRVLPLSGVTHMTPQEVVAENLLRLQVEFLHETLLR